MKDYTPNHFASLQGCGFKCDNYYWNNGGKLIGLTQAELKDIGFGETMFVHPDMLNPLREAEWMLFQKGFQMVVRDAFRSRELYNLIVKKRRALGMSVELFSPKVAPHATGLAVDVDIRSVEGGYPVMTRSNCELPDCAVYGFYADREDKRSRTFHRIQKVLVDIFLEAGFQLGGKREYWHFELRGIEKAPRF